MIYLFRGLNPENSENRFEKRFLTTLSPKFLGLILVNVNNGKFLQKFWGYYYEFSRWSSTIKPQNL